MLKTILDNLNREQRDKLLEMGMLTQTITDLKGGRGLPTEIQVVMIATACGVDRHLLQDEVTLLRAKPGQREVLQKIMGKLQRGAVAMLAYGAIVGAATVGLYDRAHAAGATMYRGQRDRRKGDRRAHARSR